MLCLAGCKQTVRLYWSVQNWQQQLYTRTIQRDTVRQKMETSYKFYFEMKKGYFIPNFLPFHKVTSVPSVRYCYRRSSLQCAHGTMRPTIVIAVRSRCKATNNPSQCMNKAGSKIKSRTIIQLFQRQADGDEVFGSALMRSNYCTHQSYDEITFSDSLCHDFRRACALKVSTAEPH